jgi:hypothetical protein
MYEVRFMGLAFDYLFEKTASTPNEVDEMALKLLERKRYYDAEQLEKDVAEFQRKNKPKFYAGTAAGAALGTTATAAIAKLCKKPLLKPSLIALPISTALSASINLNALGKKYSKFKENLKAQYGLE